MERAKTDQRRDLHAVRYFSRRDLRQRRYRSDVGVVRDEFDGVLSRYPRSGRLFYRNADFRGDVGKASERGVDDPGERRIARKLLYSVRNAPYSKNWLRHDDLFGGNATLAFEMGPEPNKNWGSSPEDLPQSMCDETFEN